MTEVLKTLKITLIYDTFSGFSWVKDSNLFFQIRAPRGRTDSTNSSEKSLMNIILFRRQYALV